VERQWWLERYSVDELRVLAGGLDSRSLDHGGVLVMKRYGHLFPTAQAQAVSALDAFLAADAGSERDAEEAV
jgi:hypothetical protein